MNVNVCADFTSLQTPCAWWIENLFINNIDFNPMCYIDEQISRFTSCDEPPIHPQQQPTNQFCTNTRNPKNQTYTIKIYFESIKQICINICMWLEYWNVVRWVRGAFELSFLYTFYIINNSWICLTSLSFSQGNINSLSNWTSKITLKPKSFSL